MSDELPTSLGMDICERMRRVSLHGNYGHEGRCGARIWRQDIIASAAKENCNGSRSRSTASGSSSKSLDISRSSDHVSGLVRQKRVYV